MLKGFASVPALMASGEALAEDAGARGQADETQVGAVIPAEDEAKPKPRRGLLQRRLSLPEEVLSPTTGKTQPLADRKPLRRLTIELGSVTPPNGAGPASRLKLARPNALFLPKEKKCVLEQLSQDFDKCDLVARSNASIYAVEKFHPTECRFAAKVYSNEGMDPCRLEYDLMKRMSHPNIPKALSFYEGQRESGFIMEFAPGRTLERIRERDGPLSLADAFRVAEGGLSALAYVHGFHIFHHDVSCDNIMFDADSGQVFLLDWNYAQDVLASQTQASRVAHKAVGGDASRGADENAEENGAKRGEPGASEPTTADSRPAASELTTTGSWDDYGKPLYRAPAGMEGRFDEQDVYAFGVLLQLVLPAELPTEVQTWLSGFFLPPGERVTAAQALTTLTEIRPAFDIA